MNKDIKIAGATYSGVPAIKIPAPDGGTVRYTEVSDTTATAADVASGKVFYDASGNKATGTGSGSSGGEYDIFFRNKAINLTDDNIPAQNSNGQLVLVGTTGAVISIDSQKITSVNSYACSNSGRLKKVNIPNAKKIGYNAFETDTVLETICIPAAAEISPWCFAQCYNLAEINADGATKIGEYAFNGASSYTAKDIHLAFPSVKTVDGNAFGTFGGYSENNKLTIKLPEVETTGYNVFSSARFSIIDLGATLTNVASYPISGCDDLTALVIRATTPPTLQAGLIYNWNQLPTNTFIYVPDDSIETYKTATNWSKYADKFKPLSEYVEDAT